MSVVKDLAAQQTISRDSSGFRSERVFIVDQVSGAAESKIYNALQTAGIPQYGDPHPVIDGIRVTKLEGRPEKSSPSTIRVLVLYSESDADESTGDDDTGGQVTVTTSLVSEETVRDVFGELMFVEYVTVSGVSASITRKYFPANIERPQLQVSFRRTEIGSPKAKIDTYLGKVNTSEWSGYKPRTWLCTGITWSEDGDSFDVNYSFAYRPQTWDLEAFAQLTEAEATSYPIDPETGNGYSRYQVYESANFNDLGLSF